MLRYLGLGGISLHACVMFKALPFFSAVCSDVVRGGDADITSMAVCGGAIWLGTRNGYLLILDGYLMVEGKDPLLGLQRCGTGKVKCIVPLVPPKNATSKLQVYKLHHIEFISMSTK